MTLSLLSILLVLVGCQPIEQSARDTAAALNGAITAAQAQYLTTCTADKTQATCQLINRAVAAQNALITATEAYCGWSVTAPPPDPTVACQPIKAAVPALQSAINNATPFITELKGVIKP